jgi:predicted SAM-dependent methyltransferase
LTSKYLNLGCDVWKLNGFINIDINPEVKPDLVMDLTKIENHFGETSVDFIYAGHVFEHLEYQDSLKVMQQCFNILHHFRCMVVVVPDWLKASQYLKDDISTADNVILAKGEHKLLMTSERLKSMLKKSGFRIIEEIKDLNQIPYILVSNVLDPKPDPWQTAFIALKT